MASSMTGLPTIHGFRALAQDEQTEQGDVLFLRNHKGEWRYYGVAVIGMPPSAWITGCHPYRWSADTDTSIHNADANLVFSLPGYYNITEKGEKIRKGDLLMSRVGMNKYRKYVFCSGHVGMACDNWDLKLIYRKYGGPVKAVIKKKINARVTPLPLP